MNFALVLLLMFAQREVIPMPVEPADVPAIRVTPCDPKCSNYQVWTCKDRERILETSESGKRWCHQVQP